MFLSKSFIKCVNVILGLLIILNMELKEETHSEQAVFNMALDTLKRLGKNLEEQKMLEYKIQFSMEVRQAVKIGLVKQFFIQATPLLPADTVTEYKDKVLKLKSTTVKLRQKRTLQAPLNLGPQIVYDENLSIELDTIIIELQIVLQEKGYFMPPADDSGDTYR